MQCHGHQNALVWGSWLSTLYITLCKNEHILYEFGIENEIIYSILFTPMCGCMSVVGRANAVKSCLFRWPATTGPRSCLAPCSRKMIYHQHTTASNWMESGGTLESGPAVFIMWSFVTTPDTPAPGEHLALASLSLYHLNSRLGHGLGDTVLKKTFFNVNFCMKNWVKYIKFIPWIK